MSKFQNPVLHFGLSLIFVIHRSFGSLNSVNVHRNLIRVFPRIYCANSAIPLQFDLAVSRHCSTALSLRSTRQIVVCGPRVSRCWFLPLCGNRLPSFLSTSLVGRRQQPSLFIRHFFSALQLFMFAVFLAHFAVCQLHCCHIDILSILSLVLMDPSVNYGRATDYHFILHFADWASTWTLLWTCFQCLYSAFIVAGSFGFQSTPSSVLPNRDFFDV